MTSKLGAAVLGTLSLLTPGMSQVADEKNLPQPTLVMAPEPEYPPAVKDAWIGGRVTVRVAVDESGAIVSVGDPTGPARLCKGSRNDPRLGELRKSVTEAIKRAKFSPAQKDGKPIKSVTHISFVFEPFQGKPGDLGKTLITGAAMNGRILALPKPEYPRSARASRAAGAVTVKVVIDETGSVFSAQALTGNVLLWDAAIESACDAKFSPLVIDARPIYVTGLITYNFVPR